SAYRLVGASFTFDGPDTVTVAGEPDDPSVTAPLTPGIYLVSLARGWTMEHVRSDGTTEPIQAVLASEGTQRVEVCQGSMSYAYYQFLLEGAQGTGRVTFGIAQPAVLRGSMTLTTSTVPSGTDPFAADLNAEILTQIDLPLSYAGPYSDANFGKAWLAYG